MSDDLKAGERYAIELPTLTLHRPYAEHATGARRTSAAGVRAYANGRPITRCTACFPPPKPAAKSKAAKVRTVTYLAQEPGPELIVPTVAGFVIPHAGSLAEPDVQLGDDLIGTEAPSSSEGGDS